MSAWASRTTTLTGGSVPEKLEALNRRNCLFVQIETAAGAKNADEIAAVKGVDCLWVGHFDLSCSLGFPASSAIRSSSQQSSA